MRPALSYAGHPRTWHDTSSPSPFSLLFIDTMHRDGARNRLCTHERHEKTPRRDASSRPVRKTRNRSYPARAARVGRVDCRKRCGHVGVLSATAWAVRREHFNLIHSSLSRGLRAYSTRLHRAYFCPLVRAAGRIREIGVRTGACRCNNILYDSNQYRKSVHDPKHTQTHCQPVLYRVRHRQRTDGKRHTDTRQTLTNSHTQTTKSRGCVGRVGR